MKAVIFISEVWKIQFKLKLHSEIADPPYITLRF